MQPTDQGAVPDAKEKDALKALDALAKEAYGNGNGREWVEARVATIRAALATPAVDASRAFVHAATANYTQDEGWYLVTELDQWGGPYDLYISRGATAEAACGWTEEDERQYSALIEKLAAHQAALNGGKRG